MEDNKIPTTEELFEEYSDWCTFEERDNEYLVDKECFQEAMIKFAKLHVTEALKQTYDNSKMKVSENGTNEYPDFIDNYNDGYVTIIISKDSILNAYPLDLIK